MTTPKGYCTIPDDLQNYLGLSSLTAQQYLEANVLLAAAEAHIDRETRRSWLLGAITGERYDLVRSVVYLRNAPVSSIQSITRRSDQIGDTPTILTAGVDYELLDPQRGEVHFLSGYRGMHMIAFISYTPNRPVPADISLAAVQIVAATMYPTLFSSRYGMSEQKVDNIDVKYSVDGTSITVPEIAREIIASYRLPLIV